MWIWVEEGDCGSRQEAGSIILLKNHETDFLYEKPENSDLRKTAWIDMAFRGLSCK